jgi:tetratricopeptide (TPR) repeat protein
MTEKSDQLHIASDTPLRFSVNIKLGEKSYHVQTEHGGAKEPLLTTRIYHKGEIVYSKKTDCSDIMGKEDYGGKIQPLMENHYKSAIEEFTIMLQQSRKKTEYLDAAKKLLSRKNNREALKILREAVEEYPEDPLIVSYYGYLTAVVDKKYAKGTNICKKAMERLDLAFPPITRSSHAALYLNLGRTYLAGGEKKAALAAFNNGLKIDGANHDLLWEIKKLGTRKKPPLQFLSRDNPINKYIGLLLAKLKNR